MQIFFENMHANMQEKYRKYANFMQIFLDEIQIKVRKLYN